MLLHTDSRKLFPLFLVAAYHLKHFKAIQDPSLSKEILQLDQVGPFPHDEPGGSGMAPAGTMAGSQSRHVASLMTQNRIREAVGSVWRKLNTRIFGTTNRLSDERKKHIHKQLEANQDKIIAMKMEYESLLKSIKELEKQLSRQVRRRCKVTGSFRVSSVLRKLEKYHKIHTSKLIQNRLYELGGIGTTMSIIESASPSWAWNFSWKRTLAGVLPFVLSYWGGLKHLIMDAEVSRKLLSTQTIGKLLKKVELSADNLEGSSHSTHFEYKKRVEQDLDGLTSIARQNTKWSQTPTSILSGDHLKQVMEKVRIGMVQDLRNILHSITFQTNENFMPSERHFEKMLLRIKVGFEKCSGFQVLGFLYEYKFITKVEVDRFFESKETLELTARHLCDLFFDGSHPLSAYHSLVPDIDFITNDWHAGHLRYLRDLNEEKQGYIVYTILKLASGKWIERLMKVTEMNPEAANIFNHFGGKSLLNDIRNWSPKSWDKNTKNPQYDLMRNYLEKIIHLFKEFPIPTQSQTPFRNYDRLIIFLINYHILNFMKTYGNENVRSFIRAYENGDRNSELLVKIYGEKNGEALINLDFGFKTQLDLIKYGLEVHQHINHSHDYAYLLSYPKSLRHMITNQITPKVQEDLKETIHQVRHKFWYTYNRIQEFSKKDEAMKTWGENGIVNMFLEILTKSIMIKKPLVHYNMWLIHIKEHPEISPKTPNDCEELASHLTQFYNVMEQYPQWEQNCNEKLRSELILDFLSKVSRETS